MMVMIKVIPIQYLLHNRHCSKSFNFSNLFKFHSIVSEVYYYWLHFTWAKTGLQTLELCFIQPGISILRNINNLGYTDDTTLMAESEEELKSLLMKAKEKSEKVVLKLSIQKTKIIAFGLITSWQTDGETMGMVTEFIYFFTPKSLQMVTAAMKLKDACSLEEKL